MNVPLGNMSEFRDCVVQIIKKHFPDKAVDTVSDSELLVNGRRLDLENLHRMATHEPQRAGEIIEHYCRQLFEGDGNQALPSSFEQARSRLLPRVQPVSIFKHLSPDQVAHVPFVNDTVIVFVYDLPHMTVSITTEQLLCWHKDIEEIEAIARENLDQYVPELEVQLVDSKEGGRAAIISQHDGYDAARLLLTDLFNRLSPRLGGNFYVATPSRDMFVAFTPGPEPFINRLKDRVIHDYKRLPYPITPGFFLMTRDGVAGTEGAPLVRGME